MNEHCYSHKWQRLKPQVRLNGTWLWRFRCRLCATTICFQSSYQPASITAEIQEDLQTQAIERRSLSRRAAPQYQAASR